MSIKSSDLPEHIQKAIAKQGYGENVAKIGKRKSKGEEAALVHGCLEYLKMRGVFAWRQNTGAVKNDGRYIRFGLTGTADILGVLDGGRFLAIECKSAKGKQSDAQKWFEANIVSNGGLYLLVRSVDELAEGLE